MISHQHRCIFVEVPKTGSSSVRLLIGYPETPHLNICQIRQELQCHWTRRGGPWHSALKALYPLVPAEKRREAGTKLFDSYFKFAFVRNPWDRAVSLYHRKEGLQLRDKMSFDEFIEWFKYSSSTCIHPLPHVNQLDWLVDSHGNMLMDFVGKFETLAQDWAVVAAKLSLPSELPHANANAIKKKHYTEYYTQKTRDIVAHRFRTDIEYFGYTFEG